MKQSNTNVFTISYSNGTKFNFDRLERTNMRPLGAFLESNVSDEYTVTQPSILRVVGNKGVKRATVIRDYAYTITEHQDRCPAQIIAINDGSYCFLTEKECWCLMGCPDEYFYACNG